MMNSVSYGEFDDSNFQELLDFLLHINKHTKLSKLMVHPSYYAVNMLKQFSGIWYEIRRSSSAKKGYFDRLKYGDLDLEVMVCSLMNGGWCVI